MVRPHRPALIGGEVEEGEDRFSRPAQRRAAAEVQVGHGGAVARQQQVVAVVDRQVEFAVVIGTAAAAGDGGGFVDRDGQATRGERKRRR